MKKKSLIFRWMGLSVGIVLTIVFVASCYMLSFSLSPRADREAHVQTRLQELTAANPEIKPWIDSLQRIHALRDTIIYKENGERMHAYYVYAPKRTGRTALLVHGYKDSGVGMLHIAHIYAQMGYNVLLPDLYAHGQSDGDHIRMGWEDRKDVLRWSAVAHSLFGTTAQVIHGISMGAATVMMLSGDNTPDYIRCFVEDCGYTDVWDEFSGELRNQFDLPPFPLMYTTSALCKLRYGWSFAEASALKQVAQCHKPMLFIHGTADTYVPVRMVYPLYAAKPQPKQLALFPRAVHAMSYSTHRKAYIQTVKRFVEKYIDLMQSPGSTAVEA
uniref:Alpha/beta hydrolase n=1 Tax=Prevotella sp. GTC17262 TaxID=3236797 RepID=A0AB33JHM2_9BACT